MSSSEIKEDILEEDVIQIPSQKFALISIVSPQSTQKHEACGLKIRGVFATREEAEFHVKRLQKTESTFDIYLVDMYKWLLIPPDNSKIEDKEYQEDMLSQIVKGHQEQQMLAKQHHQQRVQDDIERQMNANKNTNIQVDEVIDYSAAASSSSTNP